MKYETYIDKISQEKIAHLPIYKINKYFSELINYLPNNGKLYKYRSFKHVDICKYITALREKYLWFSSASNMKDVLDSRIRIQLQKDSTELMDLIRDYPFLVFKLIYKKTDLLRDIDSNINKSILEDTIKYIDIDTGELKDELLVPAFHKYGMDTKEAKEKILALKEIVQNILEAHKDEIVKIVNQIAELPEKQREKIFIFCMCQRYDNSFLWDVYSDGDGFCIEYDFNKALLMDAEIKRKLLFTLKVNYSSAPKRFSMIDFFKGMIENEDQKTFYKKQSKLLLEQILLKESSYSSEEEWRIIQYDVTNKLYVDLVSGIIIDEKGYTNTNYKCLCELLDIAKTNNWDIIIRRFDKYNNEYYYEKLCN